jgi:hypothetical protein
MAILCEHVIGGTKGNNNLTNNCTLKNMYLLTDLYKSLKFYYKENNNNEITIGGIEFDNKIIIGVKTTTDENKKTTNLLVSDELIINKDKPHFDFMELQIRVKRIGDPGEYCYTQEISYIKIIYDNNDLKLGNRKSIYDKSDDIIYYLDHETVDKPCLISGIGLSNFGLFCFQVIENYNGDFNDQDLIEIFYDRGNISLVEASLDFKKLREEKEQIILTSFFNKHNFTKTNIVYDKTNSFHLELRKEFKKLLQDTRIVINLDKVIMDNHLIGIENPDVFNFFIDSFTRMEGWSPCIDVLYFYYPDIISLFDKALLDRDFTIMYSIPRIHRMLNYIIYNFNDDQSITKKKNIPGKEETLINKHKPLVIKYNKVWKCLTEVIKKCQQVHHSQVSLNCYHIALLSNDFTNKLYATITFLCQAGLITLMGINFKDSVIDNIFPLNEGKVIIPVIFLFTCMISYKQMLNTKDFHSIFFEKKYLSFNYSIMYLMDSICNYLFSATIVIFNFFLLSFDSSLIDIILNSIASLYIIQLDDTAIFISNDSIMDLIKQRLLQDLFDKFNNIHSIYFDSKTWYNNCGFALDAEHYQVDENTMEIVERNIEICENIEIVESTI